MSEASTFFLDSCPPDQREIIQQLRKIVKKNMPEAHEMVYHRALGYSFSSSPFDRIIYIALATNHITFGFFFGGHFPDPNHLLEGEGKRMRHVKIKSMDEANNPVLEDLIKEAWKDAQVSIPNLHK